LVVAYTVGRHKALVVALVEEEVYNNLVGRLGNRLLDIQLGMEGELLQEVA